MLTSGALNELTRVRHGFFSRNGGVSGGLYTSLNCGYGSGDGADDVRANRDRALARLDLENGVLLTPHQVHSATAVVVEEAWAPGEAPKADAVVTNRRGLAVGILTADCVPVLFAEPKAGVVAAAHAGWRGALTGILEATVVAMESLGAQRRRISAGIGPAIAQRSYEVGPEFPAAFLRENPANENFFYPARRSGHFQFDLKGYVAGRLFEAGLEQIQTLPCDTCAEEDRFFSYRRACLRGEKDYGRGLSAIFLEP